MTITEANSMPGVFYSFDWACDKRRSFIRLLFMVMQLRWTGFDYVENHMFGLN